jgi:hypothetical protein
VKSLRLLTDPGGMFSFGQHPVSPGLRRADRAAYEAERQLPPPMYPRSAVDVLQIRRVPPNVVDKLKKVAKLSRKMRHD